jgi:hypothetical protein
VQELPYLGLSQLRQHLPNPAITQNGTREPDLRSSGNNCCATQKR